MNLKCYVIDDQQHSVDILIEYINQTDGLELQGFSTNPLVALNEVTGPNPPDITFLDIEMPELSGMEFAGLTNLYTKIIFTTSFKEFAFEAFDKAAVDFLLKPIGYARFHRSVQRVKRESATKTVQGTKKRGFFFVKTGIKGRMQKVVINDIIYIEGAQNYIKVHLKDSEIKPYLTISEIEKFLDPDQFARIHQSFIINLNHMAILEQSQVILDIGISLNLGRLYKEGFIEKMNELLLKSQRKP